MFDKYFTFHLRIKHFLIGVFQRILLEDLKFLAFYFSHAHCEHEGGTLVDPIRMNRKSSIVLINERFADHQA